MQRRVLTGVAAFGAMGLAGPLLDYLLPYSGDGSSYFVYRVVTFLWPTRLLGLMLVPLERSLGYSATLAVGVAVNVVLWAVLGALAGAVSLHRGASWALPLVVSAALAALLLVLVRTPDVQEGLSLTTALVLYAVPFAVVRLRAAPGKVEAP